jgi:hypothetical protein
MGFWFHIPFWSVAVLAVLEPMAAPDLQFVPTSEPQCVFAGEGRRISVTWRNPGEKPVKTVLSTRIYQASSSTAAPWAGLPWKQLEVLPGQTILETAVFDFPAVRGETRFLIQWIDGTNKVAGLSEVLVYPTNLLHELALLAGGNPPGVFDPHNELKPPLRSAGVDFLDLEKTSLDLFSGKLAIIGPFQSVARIPEGLIKASVRKGLAVVWILPASAGAEAQPNFYLVPEGKGAVVVVRASMVSALADNPRSQLNLIHFARLALRPQPLALPDLAIQQ